MVKRIIREDEVRDQEETQDCQRSILSSLDLRHFKQLADFIKIQSPRLSCHTNRTSSSLFLSQYSFFFFLTGNKNYLFVIYYLNKNHLCYLLTTGFLNFWVARQSSHLYHLTVRRRSGWIVSILLRGYFKHSVGKERLDKANSWKQMW